jgi:ATP-dependent Clp protease adaptor protein ClpS
MAQEDRKGGVALKDRKDEKVQRPRQYRVIILNDDFTPIEFVVGLVAHVFHKTAEEAAQITMEVHQKGSAIAGVYTYEIAETKATVAMAYAEEHEYPLQVVMEPED